MVILTTMDEGRKDDGSCVPHPSSFVAGLSPGLSRDHQLSDTAHNGAFVIAGRRQVIRIARKEGIHPDLPEAILPQRLKLLAGAKMGSDPKTHLAHSPLDYRDLPAMHKKKNAEHPVDVVSAWERRRPERGFRVEGPIPEHAVAAVAACSRRRPERKRGTCTRGDL